MLDMECSDTCKTSEKCFCYANKASTDPTRAQFCARLDSNRLVLCDPGCCNGGKGCPGLCKDAKADDPDFYDDRIEIVDKILNLKDLTIDTIPIPIIYLMAALILLGILSTLALFLRGESIIKVIKALIRI